MRFPTMLHFDKCRLRQACAYAVRSVESLNIQAFSKGSDQTVRMHRVV